MRGIIDRTPAFFPALGVAAGILSYSFGFGVWLPCVLAAVGVYVLVFRRHASATGLVAAALGWFSAAMAAPVPAPPALLDSGVRTYSATVCGGDLRASGSADLAIDSVMSGGRFVAVTPFRVLVLLSAPDYDLYEGSRVICSGELQPLRTIADMPHAVVPHDFARRRGCVAQLNLSAPSSVTVAGEPSRTARSRLCVERLLLEAGAGDPAIALFSAIIAGDASMLAPDSVENFRAAGVAHALVLSGFHVGMVALFASLFLFPLRLWTRAWWLVNVGVILAVWAFAAFTGFGSSTVRACVMITALLVVRLSGRDASVWNSLFLAVALILCAAPAEIYSPGFQLSVAAVAGILAFSGPMNPFAPRRRLARAAAGFVTVPLSAMLGTMVIVAAYFHVLPVYFIMSDMLVSLLFPVLMFCGVLLLCCGALGARAGWVADISDGLCGFLDDAVAEISSWTCAQAGPIFLTGPALAAVAVLLLAGAVALNIPRRRVALVCVAVMAGAVVTAFVSAPRIPRAEIFVVPYAGDTSVLLRCGDSCIAVATSRHGHRAASMRRLRRTAARYLESRGCDTIAPAPDRFTFGPFRRDGQFIKAGNTLVAVPAAGRHVDSVACRVNHLLLTGRCTAEPANVLDRLRPDTLMISVDVSPGRRADYIREAGRRGIAVVDLRHSASSEFLRVD